MTSNNQFSVMLIDLHLCDLRLKYILDDTDWHARPCIPNLNRFVSSNIYLKSLVTENSATDGTVISDIWLERPLILIDLPDS